MKSTISLLAALIILMCASVIQAQVAPINFEPGGNGANWTWTVFENATNPPVVIMDNPHPNGINTSAKVAQFTALQAGQPWAGCESQHGSDIGTFTFTPANCTVKIMVWKSVISDVGIKFASASGASTGEIKVPNTVVNQWEEIVFDFSSRIGETNDQFIFFPDFNLAGRTSDNVIFWDNVTFSPQMEIPSPTVPAPTPTYPAANVISLFSDAYTNVPVDTWSAGWDMADVADVQLNGNHMKLYSNLVYAGIEFTSTPINATGMTHFRMDIWTHDPTAMPAEFKIKLVDFGANGVWGGGDDTEHELAFNANSTPALVSDAWITFDIPLSDFVGMTARGHVAQLIISGTPNTVYVDNVLFRNHTTANDDHTAVPVPATLGNSYPNPFHPSTTIAYSTAKAGHVTLKVYDVRGRLVSTLVDAYQMPSAYESGFNGAGMTPGVYFYRLTLDGKTVATRRMILVK